MLPVLTAASLLLYFVALDLLVGGTVVAVNAWVRRTPPHRELLGRLVPALPLTLLATAVLGAGALVAIRAQYGVPGAAPELPVGLVARTPVPRLAHVLIAGLAVTGAALAQLALRLRTDRPAFGAWLARHGAAWMVFATLVNLLVGAWWFVRLPHETLIRFTGADRADMITFSIAIVSAMLALGFAAMSATVADPRRYTHAATVMLAVTLAAMVRMREALRPDTPAAGETPWIAVAGSIALMLVGVLVFARTARAFVGDASGERS